MREREREGGRGKQTDGSLRLHTKIKENKLFLDFKYFLHILRPSLMLLIQSTDPHAF